jgi:hypothetical protein
MLALVLNSDVPTGGRFYDVANVPLKHIGSGGVKQRCGESEHPPLPDESLDHYEDVHLVSQCCLNDQQCCFCFVKL